MRKLSDAYRSDRYCWIRWRSRGMNVPGLIFADTYIESLLEGRMLPQVANVRLPGIAGRQCPIFTRATGSP